MCLTCYINLGILSTSQCQLSYYIYFFWQSFLNMQLYERALDLFEDDQSTSVSFLNDENF